jgi:beta-1,4-mannosyltransferase
MARPDLLTTYNRQTGETTLRTDRPALVVSSTSWTPDEDFSVLLSALDSYASHPDRPALLVLISGKGPLKESFIAAVSSRESSGAWRNVVVRTTWLRMEDYPVFLGSADLGVSLHSSSSGLDLPMKVVDLFGCRVPVLARGFQW